MSSLVYEIAELEDDFEETAPSRWMVLAWDDEARGYYVEFTGQDAQERAQEYLAWVNRSD